MKKLKAQYFELHQIKREVQQLSYSNFHYVHDYVRDLHGYDRDDLRDCDHVCDRDYDCLCDRDRVCSFRRVCVKLIFLVLLFFHENVCSFKYACGLVL